MSRWILVGGRLCEAQFKTLNKPNTGMAVAIEADGDLHPRNKQETGLRLALLAMNLVYGKAGVISSGPVFEKMKVEGDKIRLSFKYIGEGIVNKSEEAIKGFAIAGAKQKIF